MKRFWIVVLFLFLGAPYALGQDTSAEVPFPKDLIVMLPQDGSVTLEWIAAPLSAAEVSKAAMRDIVFRMDHKNNVWIGYNQKYLANLGSEFSFSLGRPVRDFLFLDNGELFLASETALGFIPPFNNKEVLALDKGIPIFPFQPLCSLPLKQCVLAPNGRGSVYIYGFDHALKAYAVYELLYEENKAYDKGKKTIKGWGKVFLSTDKISAVVVSQGNTYIAEGRTVFKLIPGKPEPVIAFVHPREKNTGLAASPEGGIFYATNSGIGLIKNGMSLEFMKYPSAQMVQQEKALYILLPDCLGVLKLGSFCS